MDGTKKRSAYPSLLPQDPAERRDKKKDNMYFILRWGVCTCVRKEVAICFCFIWLIYARVRTESKKVAWCEWIRLRGERGGKGVSCLQLKMSTRSGGGFLALENHGLQGPGL